MSRSYSYWLLSIYVFQLVFFLLITSVTGTPTTQITKTVKLSSKYFGVSFGVSAMDNTYSDSDINLVFPDLIEMDQRQNTTSLDYRRKY